jgi:hypothetical protein
MKKIKILYWVFTGLFLALMLASAIPDILVDPVAVKGMHDGLGFPVYLIPFLGVAKAIGVLAILLPVNPRIKEWAYAGLFIDLIGATYSIIAVGSPAPNYLFMLLPLTLAALSYVFYQKKAGRQQKEPVSRIGAKTFSANPVLQ